ncbi:hypothetical protein ABT56_08165 [Photobacterium aquae]|uniref:Lysine-N-methylase n=1 Tax=Photobacterium aquae TaxID=1195763 RepID=A0A0J1H496_9GAMM|nr:flagellin lysine-N-methylase [Photobacterium aquae]KLV06596.1 hypothetical protein ABT56_08165 [Photobacterium aquae]
MKQIELIPQFVERFSCATDRCEDHCCQGWNIYFDKPTYRFLTEKSVFKDRAQQAFIKKPKTNLPMAEAYAMIKFNEKGFCPFRDAQGLCDVHKHYGHQRLAKICQSYPRVDTVRGDRIDRGLTLSCPEAARQVLLNPSAMSFSEKVRFTAVKPAVYRTPFYYQELRQLYVDVLLMEGVSLESRLYMLGMTLKLLDEKKDDEQAFQQTLNFCIDSIVDGSFLAMFEQSGTMLDMHATFLIRLYNARLAMGVNDNYEHVVARIKQVHTLLDQTLGQAECDAEAQQAILLKGYQGHYSDYVESNSHVWVNYFLHGMYMADFPAKDFYKTFSEQVIDFFMLRGALMAIGSSRELVDDDVILVVQSYHRSRSHTENVSIVINRLINNHLQIDEAMLPLLLLKVA